MRFLNPKEEVYKVKITPWGKYLLSQGKFNPTYYAFFDDDIIYDSSFLESTGYSSEEQNKIQERILDETPRFEGQTSFEGSETTIFTKFPNLLDEMFPGVTEKLDDPSYNINSFSQPLNNYYLQKPLGKSGNNTSVSPFYSLTTLKGDVLSASLDGSGSSGYFANKTQNPTSFISQVDFELRDEITINTTPNKTITPTKNIDNDELFDSFYVFKDFTSMEYEKKDLFIKLEEGNTEFLKENFDIEVFEIITTTGSGAETETKLNTYTNTKLLNFDGSNHRVYIGTHEVWNSLIGNGAGSNQKYTLSAWIHPTQLNHAGGGNFPRIFDFGTQDVALLINSSGRLIFNNRFENGQAEFNTATNTIQINRWYHVAVTYDANSPTNTPVFYVNGEVVAIDNAVPSSGGNSGIAGSNCFIGGRPTGGRYFKGFMDELSVWNDVLTVNEVKEIYNGSGGVIFDGTTLLAGGGIYERGVGDLSEHTAASKLIAWWRSDDYFTSNALPDSAGSTNGSLQTAAMVIDNDGSSVEVLQPVTLYEIVKKGTENLKKLSFTKDNNNPTKNNVEYYFNIFTDNEISTNTYCDAVSKNNKTKDIFSDNTFKCPDILQEKINLNIYNTDKIIDPPDKC